MVDLNSKRSLILPNRYHFKTLLHAIQLSTFLFLLAQYQNGRFFLSLACHVLHEKLRSSIVRNGMIIITHLGNVATYLWHSFNYLHRIFLIKRKKQKQITVRLLIGHQSLCIAILLYLFTCTFDKC